MPRSEYHGALICGVAFACYATISLLWTSDLGWSAVHWGTLFLAFGLGLWIASLRLIWVYICFAVTINFAIAMGQQHILDIPLAYGLAGNPNYFGSIAVLALAAALVYDIIWFIPLGLWALLWCQSRGSLIAGVIVLVVHFGKRYPVSAFAIACLGGIFTFYYSINRGLPALERIGVWQDTLNHLTIFGSGLGSFFVDYQSWPFHVGPRIPVPPHAYNDFVELLYEFGIGTLFLWGLYILAFESQRNPLILIGFLSLGLFYFPLYIPLVSHLAVATLGHLVAGLRKETSNGTLATYHPSLS